MVFNIISPKDRKKTAISLASILFVFISFLVNNVKAQTRLDDSIKSLNLMVRINALAKKEPALAYNFSDSIIKSNKDKPVSVELGCAYKSIGTHYFNLKEFDHAQNYYKRAITIFKAINLSYQVDHCNFLIGDCLRYKGNTNGAIQQYKKTIALYEKNGNIKRVGDVNNELGRLYKTKGEFENALERYFLALDSYKKSNNTYGQALMYNNIADLFIILGIFEPSKEYLLKSIQLSHDNGDLSIECLANETLGSGYLQNGELKAGLLHLEEAVRLASKPFTLGSETVVYIYISAANANLLNNNIEIAEKYLNIAKKLNVDSSKTYEDGYYSIIKGKLLLKKGELSNAEKEFKNALDYATLLGSSPLKIESLEELRKIYANSGRFKLTYLTQEEINRLKKEINTDGISKKTAIYLINSKFIAKEKQQDLLKKQEQEILKSKIKLKNLILISLVIIIFIISILIYNSYKNTKKEKVVSKLLKEKNNLIETKSSKIEIQAELLTQANHTKDLIFTILAHDLRNPLNQIQMLLNLIEMEGIDKDDIEGLIPKISHGVKDTSETLDSLLFWAKSQMNGFKLIITKTNLKDYIDNEIKNLSSLLRDKNLSLVNTISDNLNIDFDLSLIRIVLRNFVTNAIKFSHLGGKIEIIHQEDSSFHYINVKDLGVGMSQTAKNKLFTNLTVSTVGTNKEKGSGVGLIFCQDLIQKNGGSIKVDSEINKGTTFSFSIPK
jgi:signal transduction histidine kinase